MIEILLKADDVAKILGVSQKTVHKLARESKLESVRVTSRDRRFTREQIQMYIERQSNHVIDNNSKHRLPSAPKGGMKSSGVERQGLLKTEIKALCR